VKLSKTATETTETTETLQRLHGLHDAYGDEALSRARAARAMRVGQVVGGGCHKISPPIEFPKIRQCGSHQRHGTGRPYC
jgi:hypothetical protein